jgi:hypothetical protein
MGEVPSGGVLREEHCGVITAIPELGESSRCEKRVISGFSTVSLPRDEGSSSKLVAGFAFLIPTNL